MSTLCTRRAAALAGMALASAMALAPAATRAADVGVSISVSQPGVYGRIDIGRFPQPAVVVTQPVVVAAPAARASTEPVYLWVPEGHRKHWSKHCRRYNACGVPVYFVRNDWYRRHVMGATPLQPVKSKSKAVHSPNAFPHRDQDQARGRTWQHGEGPGNGRGEGRGEGRGNGHGRGHGHDKG